jgi:hypothetical protein
MISGTVLSVDPDDGLVVLDKGLDDGVEVGFTFSVYRGALFKGKVRVDRVEPHRCFARVFPEKSPMAPGDRAATRL